MKSLKRGLGGSPNRVWAIAQCVEENVVSEQAAKRPTIETDSNRKGCGKQRTRPDK